MTISMQLSNLIRRVRNYIVAKLGVACGEGALVLAFSLRKPCKEGKGNKKDGVGVVSFCFFFFKKNFLSLYWEFEKLYDNNARKCYSKLYDKKGNVFLRSLRGI
jgi:hypothetical protein